MNRASGPEVYLMIRLWRDGGCRIYLVCVCDLTYSFLLWVQHSLSVRFPCLGGFTEMSNTRYMCLHVTLTLYWPIIDLHLYQVSLLGLFVCLFLV